MSSYVCQQCGKVFERTVSPAQPTPKYCSRKCFSLSQRKRITVTCARCGIEFERPPWHANREQKHYCSKECQFPETYITCEWCGKRKRVPPSAIKEHNFCSRVCCRAWQGAEGLVGQPYAQVEVICDTCGKSFARQQNAVNEHNYCSKECFYVAHRDNMAGDNNPAWRGGYEPYYGPDWDRQAERVRAMDGYQCKHCGITQSELGKTLHVHHIKPLRLFGREFQAANAPENLVSLCPSCHKFLEWHPEEMQAFVQSFPARNEHERGQFRHIRA